jgi:heptosyltransferase-3
MNRLDLPPRPRILVVTLRRFGDVLLTTPLIRSLRRAWPDATIHALVFADTAGILAGNPDLDGVMTIPPQPSMAQTLALGARLFRRYDLAISTQSGDRPIGFAVVAARKCVAPVPANFNGRLKQTLLYRSIANARGLHRV